MAECTKGQRLPETDSIQELARFWDTHDLTDFEADLEEVGEAVFVRCKRASLSVDLPPTGDSARKANRKVEGRKGNHDAP